MLKHYADLFNITSGDNLDNPTNYWGYVLTMGSTEGNMYALYSAREYLIGTAVATVDEGEKQKNFHI